MDIQNREQFERLISEALAQIHTSMKERGSLAIRSHLFLIVARKV